MLPIYFLICPARCTKGLSVVAPVHRRETAKTDDFVVCTYEGVFFMHRNYGTTTATAVAAAMGPSLLAVR